MKARDVSISCIVITAAATSVVQHLTQSNPDPNCWIGRKIFVRPPPLDKSREVWSQESWNSSHEESTLGERSVKFHRKLTSNQPDFQGKITTNQTDFPQWLVPGQTPLLSATASSFVKPGSVSVNWGDLSETYQSLEIHRSTGDNG